jgi:hypothetical protein
VRHIRAGTVTYDTDDYATAAVMTLISKREFQVMRDMARSIARTSLTTSKMTRSGLNIWLQI